MTDALYHDECYEEQNPAYRGTVFIFLHNLIMQANTYIHEKRIQHIIDFLKVGIWHVRHDDVSPWLYFTYSIIKKYCLQ